MASRRSPPHPAADALCSQAFGKLFEVARSIISQQLLAAGLRQHRHRGEDQAIGHQREEADGEAESERRAEISHEAGKQRADAAAEIIAEALAGAATARRVELGHERPHSPDASIKTRRSSRAS